MATLHVVHSVIKIPGTFPPRSKSFFSLQVFYTLHGPHFLNEKKIKWFPSTTTQKFTLQILFVDFSIKAQALLQTINLKSLQAKAQLKKLVVLTLHCCSFITNSLLRAAHLRSPIHFYTTKYILQCIPYITFHYLKIKINKARSYKSAQRELSVHILIDKSSSEFTNDIVQLIPCLKYCKLKAFYHFVLQNNCSYANKEQFMDRMQMEILICCLSQ